MTTEAAIERVSATAVDQDGLLAQGSARQLIDLLAPIMGLRDKVREIPSLKGALIKRSGWEVSAYTTSIKIEYRAIARLGAEGGGAAAVVDADAIVRVLKRLPAGDYVTLTQEGDTTTLTRGGNAYRFLSYEAGGFPLFKETDIGSGSTKLKLSAPELHLGLSTIAHAIAVGDIRHYLNTVCMRFTGGRTRLIATDGHRIAMFELTTRTDPDYAQELLVPGEAVRQIIKTTKSYGGTVDVDLNGDDPTSAAFGFGSITLQTELISANYPDVSKLDGTPAEPFVAVQLPRREAVAALKRLVPTKSKRPTPVSLEVAENRCKLSVELDGRECIEEIAIDYAGEPVFVGFNSRYLVDAFESADTLFVKLSIPLTKDEYGVIKGPCLATFEKYPNYTSVVMNMRV